MIDIFIQYRSIRRTHLNMFEKFGGRDTHKKGFIRGASHSYMLLLIHIIVSISQLGQIVINSSSEKEREEDAIS